MTPEQLGLVRQTFAKVMTIKMQVGRLFYDRLFTIAPEVRPMFKADIDSQVEKLMDTLALAIGAMEKPHLLQDLLAGLARRHVTYGVKSEHYDKVGEALLWTLDKGLGPDFTPPVKAAWTTLYGEVASSMRMSAARAG